MKSDGIAGSIQVCEVSCQLLKDKYLLEIQDLIKIKCKEKMIIESTKINKLKKLIYLRTYAHSTNSRRSWRLGGSRN
ncbi:adenylate/guanylate cyclase with integral membrane sensor [Nostoc commune NIES-4072]|uniref:Adenylate/guanylate cyclase with integral membrane sensor n=1 Tax=Nostoc commune NIES-4072 TaxID=2005467 RepID=A0A2R5FN23_NOSCO|nr:adenylate/guanylate cyclase with integral membrane sensor [Nostoc commune HK-02]GBG17663.1 adenylate/guanylate cyclase with integral membrane sensor [Nostoc commune NIES-4072]